MRFGVTDGCGGGFDLWSNACHGPLAAGISAAMSVVGTLVGAAGAIAQGNAAKEAADFQAKQLERKATEERAASQREAETKKKELDFALSRQQAGAAASGLGSLDSTILDLASDTTVQGEMNQKMVRYGGEERRAGLLDQAAAARASGKAEQQGSYYKAAGTLASGFSSFFGKYAESSAKPSGTSQPLYSSNSGGAYG